MNPTPASTVTLEQMEAWLLDVLPSGRRTPQQLDWDAAIYKAILAHLRTSAPPAFDLLSHLEQQRAWSERTFGPGHRTEGVSDHIRKELTEIARDPLDLEEWVDVTLLALDGAWRAGHSSQAICEMLAFKLAKNMARAWPDWRTVPAGKAIEHDRSGESNGTGAAPKGEPATADESAPLTDSFGVTVQMNYRLGFISVSDQQGNCYATGPVGLMHHFYRSDKDEQYKPRRATPLPAPAQGVSDRAPAIGDHVNECVCGECCCCKRDAEYRELQRLRAAISKETK